MPRFFSLKIIFYLCLLLILDVCLMPHFGIFRPVLTYLWVLFVAFNAPAGIFPAALLAGGLRDLVSSQPLGVETASLVIASVGLVYVMRKLEHGFFPVRLVVGVAFVFCGMLLNLLLSGFLFSTVPVSWEMIFSCFASAVVSAVAIPLFFYVTGKWFREGEDRGLKQYELFN